MKQKQHGNQPMTATYGDDTYPILPKATDPLMLRDSASIPTMPQTNFQRFSYGVHLFLQALVRKINRLLTFGLALLLLLLFVRFLLHFFEITSSLFALWTYQLSDPLVYPFQGMMPLLPYNGYSIDVSTLVAIVVYALLIKIFTTFLSIVVE